MVVVVCSAGDGEDRLLSAVEVWAFQKQIETGSPNRLITPGFIFESYQPF